MLHSRPLYVDRFPPPSRATAETETPLRRPRMVTLPEKTQGFAPESLFKPDFTRSRLQGVDVDDDDDDGGDDDVVGMMMWLTSWRLT